MAVSCIDRFEKENNQSLHFAYASNMSHRKMQKFAPEAEVVCIACLNGWKLMMNHQWFDGSAKATIVPSVKAEKVWGVLYQVDKLGLAALDAMERLNIEYQRQCLEIVSTKGKVYRAWVYIGLNSVKNKIFPTSEYCRKILAGAIENRLPENYIRDTLQVVTDKPS
jgi:gamma-glutamylcyclotransferase